MHGGEVSYLWHEKTLLFFFYRYLIPLGSGTIDTVGNVMGAGAFVFQHGDEVSYLRYEKSLLFFFYRYLIPLGSGIINWTGAVRRPISVEKKM